MPRSPLLVRSLVKYVLSIRSDRITIPSKEDQEIELSLKQCENQNRIEQRKVESKKVRTLITTSVGFLFHCVLL